MYKRRRSVPETRRDLFQTVCIRRQKCMVVRRVQMCVARAELYCLCQEQIETNALFRKQLDKDACCTREWQLARSMYPLKIVRHDRNLHRFASLIIFAERRRMILNSVQVATYLFMLFVHIKSKEKKGYGSNDWFD